MKHLIIGNGINIQFSGREYTAPQIVYRVLKNCDRDDFPTHIIVDSPYLLKDLLGRLYLEIRNVVNGEYDQYANCTAELNAINSFKEQYSDRIQELNMTDIGFEDYYLVHDLVCHKHHIGNPGMFYTREAMRIALYLSNSEARKQIDSWTHDSNKLTANLGYAIQLKAKNPELKVTDDYHFSELSLIKGSIDILGLSPWNDFHIFETIDSSDVDCCTYYYYSKNQCAKVAVLLPTLKQKGVLKFESSDTFWRNCK